MNRPLANFTPSIWGDYFLSYASKSTEMENTEVVETIFKLKKEVKKMFDVEVVQNTREKLDLIDAVQRLGVSCHFEKEIEATMQKLHKDVIGEHGDGPDSDIDGDLYADALRFRLLRQEGYNVPCDVFMKFKDNEGKFKESLASDTPGMLSLYEASHLRVNGEEILDEALVFTTTHLKCIASSLSSPLRDQVKHALKYPIRRSMERRETRRYLAIYEQDDSRSEALLTLAKLDFNQLQLLYKKELGELTRWWLDFGSRAKLLGFSRDRIVESFYWSLGVFSEAKYSLSRIMFAKQICIITIIDDIYDSFGMLDELELFTEALERWDISLVDILPEYMKLSYKETLDFYDEVDEKLAKGRSYCSTVYFKEAILRLVRAYFQEAKWMHKKEIPTLEEYLPNSYNSAGSFFLIVLALIGMGDHEVTKDSLDWVLTDPKIVRALSVISRIKNDIGHHKIEQRRSGHVVSTALNCYMKQHGTTEEEAVCELTKQVLDAWKDVNEECLKPSIPRPLIMRILEIVRTNDDIYTDGDAFTEGVLIKDMVTSLIINPVPI